METKRLWQSRTFWAALIPVLTGSLSTFGVIPEGERQGIEQVALNILGVAGAIGAIFYRVKAKKVVK